MWRRFLNRAWALCVCVCVCVYVCVTVSKWEENESQRGTREDWDRPEFVSSVVRTQRRGRIRQIVSWRTVPSCDPGRRRRSTEQLPPEESPGVVLRGADSQHSSVEVPADCPFPVGVVSREPSSELESCGPCRPPARPTGQLWWIPRLSCCRYRWRVWHQSATTDAWQTKLVSTHYCC